MSGDVGIYFIDCVRMEVFSLKQSGKDDFEFGKVCLAFSTTALRESDTLSCWLLRSLVPVWMMMWLGWPSWDSVRSSRALLVLGHQCLTALCRGKSCFVYEFPIRINEQGYFWSFCAGWCWAAVRWVLLVLCWGTGHEVLWWLWAVWVGSLWVWTEGWVLTPCVMWLWGGGQCLRSVDLLWFLSGQE